MRGRLLIALVMGLTAAFAPTAASAASLDQQHATLQFQGTMTTHWSLGPNEVGSSDPCYTVMEHGSGAQIVHVHQSGRATVTILDSSTLFFQLNVADRAAPGERAIGFNLASFERHGTVEDDYEAAQNYPGTCDPPPAPHLWDDSGCGGQHMPWDVQILVVGRKFMPTVSGFPTNDAMVKCPFFQPPGINAAGPESGDFPRGTFARISVAEVRRALSHRHGKLIVHGSQRWQTPANPAGNVVTATTTVSWKATLIRAAG